MTIPEIAQEQEPEHSKVETGHGETVDRQPAIPLIVRVAAVCFVALTVGVLVYRDAAKTEKLDEPPLASFLRPEESMNAPPLDSTGGQQPGKARSREESAQDSVPKSHAAKSAEHEFDRETYEANLRETLDQLNREEEMRQKRIDDAMKRLEAQYEYEEQVRTWQLQQQAAQLLQRQAQLEEIQRQARLREQHQLYLEQQRQAQLLERQRALNNMTGALDAPAPTGTVVESRIDGDFEGWEGETVVALTNGQVWQQTDYRIHYHYAFMPDVLVYKSGAFWNMKVEGIREPVRVERLR